MFPAFKVFEEWIFSSLMNLLCPCGNVVHVACLVAASFGSASIFIYQSWLIYRLIFELSVELVKDVLLNLLADAIWAIACYITASFLLLKRLLIESSRDPNLSSVSKSYKR